jgi:hypothetical protein
MRDKRLEVGGRRQIKNRKMGGSEVGKLKAESSKSMIRRFLEAQRAEV